MITKVIAQDKIDKVEKYIDKGRRFVILTHVSPDGDAIGSSLALYHYLMACDKVVTVIIPNEMPSFLTWLKGAKDILNYEKYPDYAAQLISEAEVIFCLDFNVPKRIGNVASHLVAASGRKVLIDHHLNPDPDFKVSISYPGISSTSELVFRLICRMGNFEMISKSCAEAIYTGMMTDTGGFTYNSNNPEIYFIISELIKKGIDKDWIYARVFNTYSEKRIRLMGYVLYKKLKVYSDYGAALIVLSDEELKRFDYKKGDTEGFVNLPMSIDGVVFSTLIREMKGLVKLSFRSVGDFPCNSFASAHFGGGGHKNASGGEFYGTLEEAVALFEKVLPDYVPALQEELKKRNRRA
ncbi:MAG: bifunctional oligoribonuclease/PAP phosphatase NrnA [Bacteroidales bacterium]|nr:bifunctional oligoribonuclease/PAP phosphatase NrnA [Bacteroidales bacterium]